MRLLKVAVAACLLLLSVHGASVIHDGKQVAMEIISPVNNQKMVSTVVISRHRDDSYSTHLRIRVTISCITMQILC